MEGSVSPATRVASIEPSLPQAGFGMNRRPTGPWALVALLWFVALLNYLDRQVIFAVFPLLRKELSMSDIELGLLGSAFLWVYGVSSPLAGFLADRWGRRVVILSSLVIWSAVTWATAYAGSVGQLLAARAVMGLSEACYLPAALAMINDVHSDRTRSRASGLHQSGIYFGAAFGGALGGWLGEVFGWRPAFRLLGIVGVAYGAILLVLLRTSERPAAESGGSSMPFASALREVLALPGYGAMLASFGLTSASAWVVYTWMPLYIYERFQLSLLEAGFYATFSIQAASLAGILVGGMVSDRWGARNPRARVRLQAVALIGSAPALFASGVAPSATLLVIALVFFGFGRGAWDCNVMPVLTMVARPELRATAYGMFNFVGNVVGGVAALGAGVMKSALGISSALQVAGVLWLLAGVAVLLIRHPRIAGVSAKNAEDSTPSPDCGRG
jgi:MFS family permease